MCACLSRRMTGLGNLFFIWKRSVVELAACIYPCSQHNTASARHLALEDHPIPTHTLPIFYQSHSSHLVLIYHTEINQYWLRKCTKPFIKNFQLKKTPKTYLHVLALSYWVLANLFLRFGIKRVKCTLTSLLGSHCSHRLCNNFQNNVGLWYESDEATIWYR